MSRKKKGKARNGEMGEKDGPKSSGLGDIKKVIGLLTARERRSLVYVILGATFMAIIEVAGIGSIGPFMSVVTNPDIIHTNQILAWVYGNFGFASEMDFMIALGVGVLAFLILSNVAQIFFHYLKVRFSSMRNYSLTTRMFTTYVTQNYGFFLNRNSHEFVKNITGEVQHMVAGTVMQFIDIVSKSIQTCLITVFLFAVSPLSTLAIALSLALFYGSAYLAAKGRLKKLGEDRYTLTRERSRVVSETFWGIKEVKIMGLESRFRDEFVAPALQIARNATKYQLLGDIPKFILETIAFCGIMVFVLASIISNNGFSDAASVVAMYAFAAYKLMPALQGLFKSITNIKYQSPAAKKMLVEFEYEKSTAKLNRKLPEPLALEREIRIRDLTFRYPSSESNVIDGIDFSIKKNSSVGLVGKTGSGKTTLVDIILGLHEPTGGALLVDDTELNPGNLPNWRANLGYVPQFIYLSNASIYQNIAFGVPYDEIDREQVHRVAALAQIHEFIESELPLRYDTPIGERGIRLSGGQRQRIGIARALYRNPEVLVFDEATSALDDQTESAVMDAITSLMGTKTIILIAHRLTTLRNCDSIVLLENGKITDSGTYKELSRRNPYFRQVVFAENRDFQKESME